MAIVAVHPNHFCSVSRPPPNILLHTLCLNLLYPLLVGFLHPLCAADCKNRRPWRFYFVLIFSLPLQSWLWQMLLTSRGLFSKDNLQLKIMTKIVKGKKKPHRCEIFIHRFLLVQLSLTWMSSHIVPPLACISGDLCHSVMLRQRNKQGHPFTCIQVCFW